jgi:hypothetical protein
VVASDTQKTSGRVVGYYQTCGGVNIYQIDAVLEPCNFAALQLTGEGLSADYEAPPEEGVPVATRSGTLAEPPAASNISFIPRPVTVTKRNSAASATCSTLLVTAAALFGLLL